MWNQYSGGPSASTAAPLSGPTAGAGTTSGWHPTVVYMLGLVVAEIIVVGFLSRHLLS